MTTPSGGVIKGKAKNAVALFKLGMRSCRLLRCLHLLVLKVRRSERLPGPQTKGTRARNGTHPGTLLWPPGSAGRSPRRCRPAGPPAGPESPQPSPWHRPPPRRHGPAGRETGRVSTGSVACPRPPLAHGVAQAPTHPEEVGADPAGGQLHVEGRQVLFACA